jgi:hypothetical protein
MWILLSAAHAATIALPSEGVVTLQRAIVMAGDAGTVEIDPSAYNASADTATLIRTDVTITSATADQAAIPPVRIEGATVALERVDLARQTNTNEPYKDLAGNSFSCTTACGISVSGGHLTVNDVEINGFGQGEVLTVVDATLTGDGLVIRSLSGGQGARIQATGGSSATMDVTRLIYKDNAVPFALSEGGSGELSVTLTNAEFVGGTAGGQALDIIEADVTMTGGYIEDFNTIGSGVIDLYGGTLVLDGVRLQDLTSQTAGALHADPSTTEPRVELIDVVAIDVTSSLGQGGLLSQTKGTLTVQGLRAQGLTAVKGGAIYTDSVSEVIVSDALVAVPTATSGGAFLHVVSADNVLLDHVVVCGGSGPSVLDVQAIETLVTHLLVFNSAGASAYVSLSGFAAELRFSTLIGDGPTKLLNLSTESQGTAHSNLFVTGHEGVNASGLGTVTLGYNLFEGVDTPVTGATLTADDWTDRSAEFWDAFDGTCASWPLLSRGSPAIDSGHPDYFDADDSRADRGAFGGLAGVDWGIEDVLGDTGGPDTGEPDTDPPDSPADSDSTPPVDTDSVGAPLLGGGLAGCRGPWAGLLLLGLGALSRRWARASTPS